MPHPLTFDYPSLVQATPAFLTLKEKFLDKQEVDAGSLRRAAWTAFGFGLSMFTPSGPPLILEGPRDYEPDDVGFEKKALEDLQVVCNTLGSNFALGAFDWRVLLRWLDALLHAILEETK